MSFWSENGFRENPFSTYVAENEPNIDMYIVKPRYFATVVERAMAADSFILFGGRGQGKSATRIGLYKEMWGKVARGEKAPLAITLDSFGRIHEGGLSQVTLERFIREIGYLMVEKVLVWLATLSDDDRNVYIDGLNKTEWKLVFSILEEFYLNIPEPVRAVTATEAMTLLNQALHKRTAMWVEKRWDAIVQVIVGITQALVKAKTDVEVEVSDGVRQILLSTQSQWNEAQFARAILYKFVEFASVFGFKGVVVLVDKVDETDCTSNSAEASAQLLFPVLANTQLMEIDGFGWLCFLWDKVADHYKPEPNKYPVRLDKIANARIQWNPQFLEQMVQKRLYYYSGGQQDGVHRLVDRTVDADNLLNQARALAMNSPREMIRVLDVVFREHDEMYYGANPSPPVTVTTVDTALDKYAKEAAYRIFQSDLVQQAVRMGETVFTNKDFQARFRVNAATARNRIRRLIDAGIYTQAGDRPAEGGGGGKPAFEYSVIDTRIRRLIERKLVDEVEFENTPEAGEE